MAKKKTLEELKVQAELSEKKLEQAKHKLTKAENRMNYLKQREQKERTHRLITRGAAFESMFKDVKKLTETEFLLLIEKMSTLPENQLLIEQAVYDHKLAEQRKEKTE